MILFLFAAFGVAVTGTVAATARLRVHPVLPLLFSALAFGLAGDMSFAYTVRSMGEGFAATVSSIGIVLVGSSIATTFLERSGGSERLAQALSCTAGRTRGSVAMALLGFAGGLGAACDFAFLLLMPLTRALSRRDGRPLAVNAIALVLSLLATHTMLVPAPGPMAAATILSADLGRTAMWGGAMAAVVCFAGWAFAVLVADRAEDVWKEPFAAATPVAKEDRPGFFVSALPILLPMLLLVISSAGHMPNEPFGGGPVRELLLALGGPVTLLLAATCGALLLPGRLRPAQLSETGWVGEAMTQVAATVLITGAAGAFARVLQNVGLGEMLAEAMVNTRIGILLPFAFAAAIKTTQGSSMLAIITASGFAQPLLGELGLDDDTGRALCVVAIGAGAIVVSHANDSLFWVVTRLSGLTPAQGYRLLTLGTLCQGAVAVAALVAIVLMVR